MGIGLMGTFQEMVFKHRILGTLYYANGNKFIGMWLNGQRNGNGINIKYSNRKTIF